jgi:PAS domain-containing protein
MSTRRHPQDRTLAQQVIERASKAGTDFEHEYRLLLPSEQRHAEAVIREQETELRQVVDTIPAIVWSARPDGSNSYVNNRIVEYFGMPPEQFAGSGWHAATHPDDLERHNSN